ncbi:MAG: hypothetical protein M3Q70_01055 [bacterium]|nr:hypothetical protein [bacterium]
MANLESEHFLADELLFVQEIVSANPEAVQERLPSDYALNYHNFFASGDGVNTIRIANWATKNQGVLYQPVRVRKNDTTWQVRGNGSDIFPVRHRVYVVDMLGRGFNFRLNENEDEEFSLTPYMQFDVIDEGIVLSMKLNGEVEQHLAEVGSVAYDSLAITARSLANLDTIRAIAA